MKKKVAEKRVERPRQVRARRPVAVVILMDTNAPLSALRERTRWIQSLPGSSVTVRAVRAVGAPAGTEYQPPSSRRLHVLRKIRDEAHDLFMEAWGAD